MEIQIIRIHLAENFILQIYTYMPPYRARLTMIKEFTTILNYIRRVYSDDVLLTQFADSKLLEK